MRVKLGWSGETERNVWHKADVELEEVDLNRIMLENDLPNWMQEKLPTAVCFKLMAGDAEQQLLQRMVALGYPADKAKARTAVLSANTQLIVDALTQKLP